MGNLMSWFDPSDLDSMESFITKLDEFSEERVTDDMLVANLTKAIVALREIKEDQYTMALLRIIMYLTHFARSEKASQTIINETLSSLYFNLIRFHLRQTKLDCKSLIVMFESLGNMTFNSSKMSSDIVNHNIHKQAFEVLKRIDIEEILGTKSVNIFTYFFQYSAAEINEFFGLYKNLINYFKQTSVHKETRDALIEIEVAEYLIAHEKKINAVKNLRKEFIHVKTNIVSIISTLLTDQELNAKEISSEISLILVEVLSEIVKSSAKNGKKSNQTKYYIVYKIDYEMQAIKTAICCAEHLTTIISVAVNDNIKKKLFEGGIMPLLREILKNGNEVELEKCVELICSLCFCESVAAFFRDNTALMQEITNIQEKTQKETTKRSCQQIKHIVSNRNIVRQISKTKSHIMISYNHKYKEDCLKINAELKKREYKTWMDVNSVFNDLHEAMAEAIENASVVLICYSHEYKISNNCRLEAEYAVKLNKPIVAVKLQRNYDPDNWLGMIIASKLYIDFSNGYIGNTFKSLCNQIDSILNNDNNTTVPETVVNTLVKNMETAVTNEAPLGQKPQDEKSPVKWTAEYVKNWLINNNMNSLVEVLKSCTGMTLKAFWDCKQKNYDQFCLVIDKEIEKSNQDVSMIEKFNFYQYLQHLFES